MTDLPYIDNLSTVRVLDFLSDATDNERIIGTRFQNPDFAGIAEAFGALGIKLSGPDELKGALRKALGENRPALIEVPVPTMSAPFS